MSGRSSSDRRSQAAPRRQGAARAADPYGTDPYGTDPYGAAPPRRKRGPHMGPVRITPFRVTLTIALLGGLAFLGYALFVRDQLQIPLMASGFAVIGLVFGAIAVICVMGVVRAGRERRDGTAVVLALLGGVIAVAALLSLAGAAVMSLIWSGTKGA